jgi:hypothetical protein
MTGEDSDGMPLRMEMTGENVADLASSARNDDAEMAG